MAIIAEDPAARLEGIISRAEPKIRSALTTAIVAMKNQIKLDDLLELIEFGRLDEAIELATEVGAIRLADEVVGTYVLAGNEGAKFLDDALDVVIGFNQTNFRAVDIMRQERLRLIQGFTAGQIATTRAAMVDGIARGLNPLKQAKAFKDSMGLTEFQLTAINKYRSLLESGSKEALSRELRDKRADKTVRAAINRNAPLTTNQVDSMVDRYRENYKKFRAEAIARTEALRAVHAGNDEAYQQAIEAGKLDPNQLVRTWITARDERVRGSHRFYSGQKRGIDEQWGPLRYPGDPLAPGRETINCRCAITTRIMSI